MNAFHAALRRAVRGGLSIALLAAACAPAATLPAPRVTAAPSAAPVTETAPPATATLAPTASAAPSVTAAPTTGAAFASQPSGQTTASGFVCPEPQPRLPLQSKSINLFLWTEYIPQDILDCFRLVYGIDVKSEFFSSNEELLAKLQAGAVAYDIVHPSDYIINVMIRSHLLQPLDPARLPNRGNIGADFLKLYGARSDYVSPYQVGSQAIVYNADTVKNPPQAWADLWRPEYARRMVFVDDSRVIIGLTLLALGDDLNTRDPQQLAAAEAKLKTLVPNVKLFDSDSPKNSLIAGDTDLGVVWNGEAFLAQREKASLRYVFPTEGAITFQDGFGIPAHAAHVDASYAWMNYLLQPDVAWLLLKDYPYTVPNTAALAFAQANHPEVYQPYIDSPITNTPAAVLLQGHQVEDVGDALQLYDRIWTEVKGGP